MSFTPEHELIIREALATKIETAAPDYDVSPAPLVYTGKEDYLAVWDPQGTRKAIEVDRPVRLITLAVIGFEDDPLEGGADSPAFDLIYEINVFEQYGVTRVNEADAFDKKMLLRHNSFAATIWNLRNEFLGNREIAGLDGNIFAVKKTTSLVLPEFLETVEESKYVQGIVGLEANLIERVRLMLREC